MYDSLRNFDRYKNVQKYVDSEAITLIEQTIQIEKLCVILIINIITMY